MGLAPLMFSFRTGRAGLFLVVVASRAPRRFEGGAESSSSSASAEDLWYRNEPPFLTVLLLPLLATLEAADTPFSRFFCKRLRQLEGPSEDVDEEGIVDAEVDVGSGRLKVDFLRVDPNTERAAPKLDRSIVPQLGSQTSPRRARRFSCFRVSHFWAWTTMAVWVYRGAFHHRSQKARWE